MENLALPRFIILVIVIPAVYPCLILNHGFSSVAPWNFKNFENNFHLFVYILKLINKSFNYYFIFQYNTFIYSKANSINHLFFFFSVVNLFRYSYIYSFFHFLFFFILFFILVFVLRHLYRASFRTFI